MRTRSSQKYDCVVVGAGLIGLCVALRLAEAGRRIAIADMAGPLHGTSGTTGALVTANEKRPWPYFRLGCAGMDEMRSFAQEASGEEWFLDTGHLEWGGTRETDAALDTRLAELESWSYPVRRLSPVEVVRDLEPDLVIPDHVKSVVFFEKDSIVHPHLMAAAILRRLRSLHADLHFGTGALRLLSGPGGRAVVETKDGRRFEAPSLVVCAGRWTQELLRDCDFELPMLAPWGRTPEALGFQVVTTPVPVDVGRMIRMPGLSIRPAGGGRLMLHGRPEETQLHAAGPPFDPVWDRPLAPSPPQALALVEKARAVLQTGELLRVQSAAFSVRAIAHDGLPVAGPIPGHPEVYVVVTHSGIGLAPLFGRLVAAELGGTVAQELEPFRPDRFLGEQWHSRPSPMRDVGLAVAPVN